MIHYPLVAEVTVRQSHLSTSLPITPTGLMPPSFPLLLIPTLGFGFCAPHIPHRPASPALMYWLSLQVSLLQRQWSLTRFGASTWEQAMHVGVPGSFSIEQIGQFFKAGCAGCAGCSLEAAASESICVGCGSDGFSEIGRAHV